jgi:hypothetical protein
MTHRTKFHEGQDVEVSTLYNPMPDTEWPPREWRKAKIVHRYGMNAEQWLVEFEGTTRRAVFDAAHIRAATRIIEVPGTCPQQHDWYQE